jgi:hypothetical protein
VVARAGHAEWAGPDGCCDLHGRVAHSPGCGRDEHGFAGLEPPPVDQSLVGGPGTDHKPCRLLEARTVGLARQVVHGRQRIVGKPARSPQIRVHLIARLDVDPIAHRLDDAGDLQTRDEGQSRRSEGAADHCGVPRADASAPHPDNRLSRRGRWIWPFTQLHAANPAQLLYKRYSHVCPSPQLVLPPPRTTLPTPPASASRIAAFPNAVPGARSQLQRGERGGADPVGAPGGAPGVGRDK